MSDLRAQLEGSAGIEDISAYLQNLGPQEQWSQLASLGKRHQQILFQRAEASPPMVLDDMVPQEEGPLVPVRHRGKNSLPVFRNFAKCFTRSDSGQIFGYNQGIVRPLIGPGYFMLRETRGPEETARGGIVVDYFEVPSGPKPPGWPMIWPNWLGLQVLVYHHMRDYLRGVCPGVSIGSAFKTMFGSERDMESYFILSRKA